MSKRKPLPAKSAGYRDSKVNFPSPLRDNLSVIRISGTLPPRVRRELANILVPGGIK
jgi:hypothetical protein